MIPHGEAVRNAVRVEWMRLEYFGDLGNAKAWVEAHGLSAHVAGGRGLIIWDEQAIRRLNAYLGQVLAFNPASGEFTVWEPEHFQAAHSEVVGV